MLLWMNELGGFPGSGGWGWLFLASSGGGGSVWPRMRLQM